MQHRNALRPLALALIAAFGPVAAIAADKELKQINVSDEVERADGPVIGYRATRSATFTKTDTPLKEVPASVTIVPAELIKDQAMQSMADVIRYVPGATAHQGEGNRDQVVLRGNSTTADFYVDGVRDDAQIFRDLYNLERVEVLKGPGGMVFGRGGAGGVLNRVTKKPVFGSVAEASLTIGSWDQVRASVDLGGKAGDAAAWRLNAMEEHARSFREGYVLRRDAINPVVTLLTGAATTLTVGYEHLRDVRTADRGVPSRNGMPYDASINTFFGNAAQSEARSSVDALSAVLDHDFGGGTQLRNSFRATHYDKFYQNIYPGSAVNAAGGMTLSAYNNANQRTNLFNQTDLTMKFAAAGFEHTVLTGLELGRQDSASMRLTGTLKSANVLAAAPWGFANKFAPAATDANNNVKTDVAAVYVQDQIALTPEWKLVAGLRYDRFATVFDDRRAANTDLGRTDTAFSPRLGAIWSPTAATSLYASYSFAFLPSGEQLSLATTTSDLAPEKAKNYEVGARVDLRPGLTLSAAVFRLDKEDVRSADPSGNGLFVKTGQQRTEGYEFGLQGEVTRNWRIYAGYANLDGRIVTPINSGTTATVASRIPAGARIGLVPMHTLSVWNRVDFADGWGAGLGVVYQSESFTSFSNTVKLPAFARADGAVYHAFPDGKTKLALNVENLFDHKYYPTADGDNNISPGAPRNARVTLTTTF